MMIILIAVHNGEVDGADRGDSIIGWLGQETHETHWAFFINPVQLC